MTGDELRALREAHGLSQKALGAMLGYDANYIYRLEKGEKIKHPIAITKRFETLVLLRLESRKRKKLSETT